MRDVLDGMAGGLAGVVKAIGAWLLASFLVYWRGLPEALHDGVYGAIILIFADTILGVMLALSKQEFSAAMLRKFFHKACMYATVVVAAAGVDRVFREPAFMQTVIVLMIALTEVLSVMDNSAELGFRWPGWLRSRAQKMFENMCEKSPLNTDPEGVVQEYDNGGMERATPDSAESAGQHRS